MKSSFYNYLHNKNKGNFYRASCIGKRKEELGHALGSGKYVTWEREMAKTFGEISCGRSNFEVEEYQLPKDLKLLDAQSGEMCELKEDMGFKCWENIGNETAGRILTYRIKKRGYDGVISDRVADGIVVFDEKKVKKVR